MEVGMKYIFVTTEEVYVIGEIYVLNKEEKLIVLKNGMIVKKKKEMINVRLGDEVVFMNGYKIISIERYNDTRKYK